MKRVILAGALCALMAGFAWAQNAGRREFLQPAAGQPAQAAGQQAQQQMQMSSTYTDAQIAAFLNGGNETEVNVAKLAEKKSQREDVKDTARKMAEAHTKLWQQLNQIAAQGGLGEQAGGNQVQQANAQQPHPMGLNFLAIEQQIGRQCETSLIRELQDKQGDKFDRAYVGWNIGAHMHMLDALKVVRGHASPQLQQTLAHAEQDAQNHLDHFKKLMNELDSGSSRTP
jgi:predicted outer membrane protein